MDRIRSAHNLVETSAACGTVRLDRFVALRTLLLGVLLLWPLIVFGHPGYIADSAAYMKGGKVSVEFVTERFVPPASVVEAPQKAVGSAAQASTEAEVEGVKGVRSIPYSVLAYLFRGPAYEMLWLSVLQSMIAAFTCAVVATAAGVRSWKGYVPICAALAFGSSLPMFTSFALPDVFAGIVAACEILLFVSYERLSRIIRVMLVGIASLAVSVHASILPLALWLCVAGTILAVWQHRHLFRPVARLAWMWTPMVLGGIATVAAGLVAFGETSVVAKHYPHALARSVSDGPARWYLEKECRTPRYAVCEVFGTRIPDTVGGFLFGDGGLDGRATPEQMDRIRAEESDIVLQAALAYPATELGNLSRNIARQFVLIGVRPGRFGDRIETDASGGPEFVEVPDHRSGVVIALNAVAYAVILACLLWVALNFRNLDREQKRTLALVLSVLAVNAAFCVLASGVSDRYQARLAWIVPIFVVSYAASRGRIPPFSANRRTGAVDQAA
jgi:hypothetical protein